MRNEDYNYLLPEIRGARYTMVLSTLFESPSITRLRLQCDVIANETILVNVKIILRTKLANILTENFSFHNNRSSVELLFDNDKRPEFYQLTN